MKKILKLPLQIRDCHWKGNLQKQKKFFQNSPFANEDIILSSQYSQISKQTPSSSSSSSILKPEPNWIVHHGCSILSDSKNYKGTGTGAEDTGIYEGFDRTIERTPYVNFQT